jgi:hypothetical protein
VASVEFAYFSQWGFAWLSSGPRTYGIVAAPAAPVDDEELCLWCPHRYIYKVFGWNDVGHKFMLLKTIEGSANKFDDGYTAYKADISYVTRAL